METERDVAKVRKLLDGEGLFCEFVAPRLWEHPKTIDGAFTSNDGSERRYALGAQRSIDIANGLGCHDLVLWLAREGTYIREAKDPIDRSTGSLPRSTRCWPTIPIFASWAK